MISFTGMGGCSGIGSQLVLRSLSAIVWMLGTGFLFIAETGLLLVTISPGSRWDGQSLVPAISWPRLVSYHLLVALLGVFVVFGDPRLLATVRCLIAYVGF